MQENIPSDERDLILLLRRDPERAMPRIFEKHYAEVCRHIYRMIPVRETCEDIAQSIFLELWNKRRTLDIKTSIGAYLHRMTLSRTLNYLRDNKKHKHDAEEELVTFSESGSDPLQQLTEKELQQVIDKAVESLPQRCREVFMLSRFEGMSYQEISRALDISVKTVENQISKALMLMRLAVQNYHRGNID